MNKKGITTLALIIIFLILLIPLIIFVKNFGNILEKFSTKQICKTAVYANAVKQIGGLEYFQRIKALFEGKKTEKGTYGIKCPTEYITISDKNKETIKQKLAMEMYECLDNFGFGTLKLFEAKTEEENYCIICHHITFKENSININAKEFDDFLETNYVKRPSVYEDIYPEERITFKQAFIGWTTDKEAFKEKEEDIKTEEYDISIEKPYTTIFTYTKKGYWDKWSASAFGAVAGTAAGLILIPFTGGGSLLILGGSILGGIGGGGIGYKLGSAKTVDWDAGIVLMPYEPVKLSKLKCTYLPNQNE